MIYNNTFCLRCNPSLNPDEHCERRHGRIANDKVDYTDTLDAEQESE